MIHTVAAYLLGQNGHAALAKHELKSPCPNELWGGECWHGCRYAWAAISEWQCQQGVTQQGMLGSEVVLSGPTALRRSHSMSCMTQLQAKHSGTPFDQLEAAAE